MWRRERERDLKKLEWNAKEAWVAMEENPEERERKK